MKAHLFPLPLILFALSCGEDATSRFVPAPERSSASSIAGSGAGDENKVVAQSQPGNSGTSASAPTAVPAAAPTPIDCAVALADFFFSVRSHGGILVREGETRVPDVVIPTVEGCEVETLIVNSSGETVLTSGTLVDLIRYVAPAQIPTDTTVALRFRVKDRADIHSDIPIRLLPTSECIVETISGQPDRVAACFVDDDGKFNGAVANVYSLPTNTTSLPDFSTMTPVQRLLATNVDVPDHNYTTGVPGVAGMNEWFGIRYAFDLLFPVDGDYGIQVSSDDGSRVWLDGVEVISNDGQHASRAKSVTRTLSAGRHTLQVDYFQGPRDRIQVQLFWQKPGETTMEIIPPSVFRRTR